MATKTLGNKPEIDCPFCYQTSLDGFGFAVEQVFGKPVFEVAGPLCGLAFYAVGCGGENREVVRSEKRRTWRMVDTASIKG